MSWIKRKSELPETNASILVFPGSKEPVPSKHHPCVPQQHILCTGTSSEGEFISCTASPSELPGVSPMEHSFTEMNQIVLQASLQAVEHELTKTKGEIAELAAQHDEALCAKDLEISQCRQELAQAGRSSMVDSGSDFVCENYEQEIKTESAIASPSSKKNALLKNELCEAQEAATAASSSKENALLKLELSEAQETSIAARSSQETEVLTHELFVAQEAAAAALSSKENQLLKQQLSEAHEAATAALASQENKLMKRQLFEAQEAAAAALASKENELLRRQLFTAQEAAAAALASTEKELMKRQLLEAQEAAAAALSSKDNEMLKHELFEAQEAATAALSSKENELLKRQLFEAQEAATAARSSNENALLKHELFEVQEAATAAFVCKENEHLKHKLAEAQEVQVATLRSDPALQSSDENLPERIRREKELSASLEKELHKRQAAVLSHEENAAHGVEEIRELLAQAQKEVAGKTLQAQEMIEVQEEVTSKEVLLQEVRESFQSHGTTAADVGGTGDEGYSNRIANEDPTPASYNPEAPACLRGSSHGVTKHHSRITSNDGQTSSTGSTSTVPNQVACCYAESHLRPQLDQYRQLLEYNDPSQNAPSDSEIEGSIEVIENAYGTPRAAPVLNTAKRVGSRIFASSRIPDSATPLAEVPSEVRRQRGDSASAALNEVPHASGGGFLSMFFCCESKPANWCQQQHRETIDDRTQPTNRKGNAALITKLQGSRRVETSEDEECIYNFNERQAGYRNAPVQFRHATAQVSQSCQVYDV